MTEGGETILFGGIEHIEGKNVYTVTDATGPVNTGTGPQFNLSWVEPEQRFRRSPRLIAEDWLNQLARRFVPPRSFGRWQQQLGEPGTLLIDDRAGTGRRTAALMLLHTSGTGADRFRELPDEAAETSRMVLDTEAIESGERLLLDLSAEAGGTVGQLGRQLIDYHSAVLQAGAYLVIVLPENAAHEVPEDLRQLVARIGRPNGAAVLHRHLVANGIDQEIDTFGVPGLALHLESDPMRELARLARLVHETREAAEGQGAPGQWLAQALEAMSVPMDEVATLFRETPDGRLRALLLTSAMFEKAPAEVVFHAAESLLMTVDFPDDNTHPLERPDLAESLHRIGASIDSERRVRLKTVTYGSAVRAYAWNSFPALRNDLCRWLDNALRMDIVSRGDRTTVLQRFSAQCLRTGHADDIFWLITRWGHESSAQAAGLITSGSEVLAHGLSDGRHSALFRRQIYTWSVSRSLPPILALALVRLCAEVIAPSRPEQALVRLRHLTRNNDHEVSAAARATLIALATEDDQFLRRVVHRLADDLRQPRPWSTDLDLFTALADPGRLTAGTRPLLDDPWSRRQIIDCWHGLMANSQVEYWATLAREWLRSAASGNGQLLDLLVAAAGKRTDLHAHLYLTARDWAVGDAAWRRTAAEMLRRSDQAQGLDLHDTRPTTATEGVVR